MTYELADMDPASKDDMKAFTMLCVKLLFVFIFLFSFTDKVFANTIKNVVLGPLEVTRGDGVVLTVEPTFSASTVEWWTHGELVCQATQCVVDTNRLSPGEYLYHVVVKQDKGLEIAEISIQVANAPPLYKARTIDSLRMGPNQRNTFVELGQWVIIPRGGLVHPQKKPGQKKSSVVNFVESASKGMRYRVGHGGTAIVRRVGFMEEWIILENASFRADDNGLELLSGSGIWRKYQSDESKVSVAKIFGLSLKSQGSQLILAGALSNPGGPSQTQIFNVEGRNVDVDCPEGLKVQIPLRGRLDLHESIHCKINIIDAWDDIEEIMSTAFPWWGELHSELPIDRWRFEADRLGLFFASDKLTENQVSEAFEAGRCGDVLDLSSRFEDLSSNAFLLRTRCQLDLGLKTEALKNLHILESRRIDPALVAYLLGRGYHQKKKLDQALYWYQQAKDRRYSNLAELSRYAVNAAQGLGLSREQLAWLDSAALSETDPIKRSNDFESQRIWRRVRPAGASLDFGLYADSQAVPANSKVIDEMPNETNTSRGLLINVEGDWWTKQHIADAASFFLGGQHKLRLPMGENQTAFAIAEHDLTLGLFFDERHLGAQRDIRKQSWVLRPAAIIGTATLGTFRVRERLGWEIVASYVRELTYSFEFQTNKYLDPAPGGVDIVDTKLYRLAGPGDFSFIDYVVKLGLTSYSDFFDWSTFIDYGLVDYRDPDFAGLDHSAWGLNVGLYRRLSATTTLELTPSYRNRVYTSPRADEFVFQVMSGLTWHFAPLWRAKIDVSFENRRVSNDPISSWSRHVYGGAVSTDF